MSVYAGDQFAYIFPKPRLDTSSPYWSQDDEYGFENWLLRLSAPSKSQLERHRSLFGPDCVHIPKETRSVQELREAGHSVRQIAHMTGKSERSVKVLLRVVS